jgi:hypothetical protein
LDGGTVREKLNRDELFRSGRSGIRCSEVLKIREKIGSFLS